MERVCKAVTDIPDTRNTDSVASTEVKMIELPGGPFNDNVPVPSIAAEPNGFGVVIVNERTEFATATTAAQFRPFCICTVMPALLPTVERHEPVIARLLLPSPATTLDVLYR